MRDHGLEPLLLDADALGDADLRAGRGASR